MFLDTAYGGPAPSPRRDRQAMRDDLSDIIHRAIAALDALDGDTDREPDEEYEHDGAEPDSDGEPSLGAPEAVMADMTWRGADGLPQVYRMTGSQIGWAAGGSDDSEDGDDNGMADAGGLSEQCGDVE